MSVVKRRVFPGPFKREAVGRLATSGLSAGAAAIELKRHEPGLWRWMMQFGTQAMGMAKRPARKRRPRRRLNLVAENTRLSQRPAKPNVRTIGFGWSRTS